MNPLACNFRLMHLNTALLACILAGFLTISGFLPAAALSGTDYARLRKGDVVVKQLDSEKSGQSGAVQASILIERPKSQVYSVMRDSRKLFANDPNIQDVKLVKTVNASRELVRYKLKLSPLLPPFVYTNQVDYTPNQAFRFKRVSGSFKSMQGACELKATGKPNETLMTYTLSMDMGGPVPPGVVNHFLASDLPKSLKRIEQTVYQQYPASK